ncbi:TrgA family protein [Aestuariibius sp. 2305UL40-4]|uniref:TrgA family protein n=1 Tax=Aestuariibius violaceus TaxID=3234132 RepID=UPI00345EB343
MPTAGRLMGAIAFAALAFYLSELYKPLMPEDANPGRLSEINALVGALVGWVIAGKRAGSGTRSAIGYGLTTAAAVIFWCLFVHAFNEMIDRALQVSYNGGMEAVVAVFDLMLEFAQPMLTQSYVIAAVIAALAAGLITELFGQRYP